MVANYFPAIITNKLVIFSMLTPITNNDPAMKAKITTIISIKPCFILFPLISDYNGALRSHAQKYAYPINAAINNTITIIANAIPYLLLLMVGLAGFEPAPLFRCGSLPIGGGTAVTGR